MTRISHFTRLGVSAAVIAGALTLAAHDAAAQGRGRRGGGAPVRIVTGPVLYYGYGIYDPFWAPMWSPFWGWYGPYGPWDRSAAYDPNLSSARLQVKPKQAEVYVDGYLAGTVDDFDGALQRLNVPAGEHAITLYLEGYQTLTQNVLFRPRATVNIKYELSKLSAGQPSGARPQPSPEAVNPMQRQAPSPQEPNGPPPRAARQRGAAFGTLAVRVQPRDAVVIVDGQEWESSGAGPLSIELAEGTHDVEVRQEGFAPFRRTVRVRAGDTTALNVSLSR